MPAQHMHQKSCQSSTCKRCNKVQRPTPCSKSRHKSSLASVGVETSQPRLTSKPLSSFLHPTPTALCFESLVMPSIPATHTSLQLQQQQHCSTTGSLPPAVPASLQPQSAHPLRLTRVSTHPLCNGTTTQSLLACCSPDLLHGMRPMQHTRQQQYIMTHSL
jgi:hypothetical protein